MRTATITFHASNNNGSFFQAYALQRVLQDMLKVENEIIDFQTPVQINQYSVFRPVHSYRDLAKNLISLMHYPKIKKRNSRFAEIRKKHLRVTERCSTIESAMNIANRFDLLIAGSDQIWNTTAPDFSEAYLLPSINKQKIAYSVSLGSISKATQLQHFTSELLSFSAISVREATAQKYVQKMIKREVDITLDPTLLLSRDDYSLFGSFSPLIDEDYILLYSINYPPEILQTAKKIANSMGLKLITVFTSFHTIICERYGIDVKYDAGPEEFLNLVKNAKLVLTNSFHGTAFSIIFEKPFYYVCRTENGVFQLDDRIANVLDALGIHNVYADTNNTPANLPEIDWGAVQNNRRQLKSQSLSFLTEAIQKEHYECCDSYSMS